MNVYSYISKNIFVKLKPSKIQGVGVFSIRDIPKDTYLFETWNDDAVETNYSDSVFIFLALVKEIQKQGNTEIQAFKKVFNNWWKSGRTDVTKEVLFEEVFGFSIDSFYLALKSYNPNINSVLPSQSIRLQDIFTE